MLWDLEFFSFSEKKPVRHEHNPEGSEDSWKYECEVCFSEYSKKDER